MPASVLITGYPFENQDTTETQYSRLFRELQDPGLMAAARSAALAASFPGGMVVRVAPGRAYGNGYVGEVPSVKDVEPDPAESQARVDRLVIRLNPTLNTATLEVLKGTRGSSVPPAITRTDTGAYDVKLYRFTVGAGAPGPTNLVDEREWVGHRVGVWTRDNLPTVATGLRPGMTGADITSERLVWNPTGVDAGWRTVLDDRDALAHTATARRGGTNDLVQTFDEPGGATLVSVTLPASFPRGVYAVTFTAVLSSTAGGMGYLRGMVGDVNVTGDDPFSVPANGRASHTATVTATLEGGVSTYVAALGIVVGGGRAEPGCRVTVTRVGTLP